MCQTAYETSQSGSATNGCVSARRRVRRQALGERRRDPEHEEQRHPLRERDVLEEVRGQEVVERDRRDGRDEHAGREGDARGERDRAGAGRTAGARGGEREPGDDGDDGDLPGGQVEAPGGGRHRGTVRHAKTVPGG